MLGAVAAAVKLTAWTRRSYCALRGLRISAIRERASRGRSGSVHVSLSPASAHLRRQDDEETKTMDECKRTTMLVHQQYDQRQLPALPKQVSRIQYNLEEAAMRQSTFYYQVS
ncbi:hypothetical protein GOP47_0003806 [Adiantum capillus-veneris]|uniref:Uncharacterized protein n=1 Tax=Adiantum capillus-veneris TaxID=13818 RepID=A0A9D4V6N0_ADICA|nr:hypothetical protein GOP47_0003806 [Adiantum capillus-veneris]